MYHSCKIKEIQGRHPEIPLSDVRRDYFFYYRRKRDLSLLAEDTIYEREVGNTESFTNRFGYSIDIIWGVDLSLPKKFEKLKKSLRKKFSR